MEPLTAIGMSLGSGVAQGAFASHSARKQMAFQERMASTQYQRAAADLEKAGLNRIIALGSPAAAPSGAAASAPNVDLGDAYVKSSSAKSAIALQTKQQNLLDSQIANTDANTAKTEAETMNLTFSGEKDLSQAALNRKQMGMVESNIGLNTAQVERIKEEMPRILAETRLAKANASEAEFKKVLYDKFSPYIDKLVDEMMQGSSVKDVGKAREAASNIVSDLIWKLSTFFVPGRYREDKLNNGESIK